MNKVLKITLIAAIACAAVALFAACVEQAPTPKASDSSSGQVNVPQEAAAVKPLDGEASTRNFYLIVDGSGSMGEKACRGDFKNRMEAAKWAVKEFVQKVVPEDVSLGLYAFDSSGTSERVPLGRNNRDLILIEVDKLRDGGGTPLSESLQFAADTLYNHKTQGLGYEFYIVVVTDGKANVDKGVRAALNAEIPIITLGFCLPKGHPLADPRYSLIYRDTQNPEQLFDALKETQAELPEYDTR